MLEFCPTFLTLVKDPCRVSKEIGSFYGEGLGAEAVDVYLLLLHPAPMGSFASWLDWLCCFSSLILEFLAHYKAVCKPLQPYFHVPIFPSVLYLILPLCVSASQGLIPPGKIQVR